MIWHIFLEMWNRLYFFEALLITCICGEWAISIQFSYVFTAQCHASAVYAIVVCLSVCLFVTSQCSTEMAKCKITQTMPHDSPGL